MLTVLHVWNIDPLFLQSMVRTFVNIRSDRCAALLVWCNKRAACSMTPSWPTSSMATSRLTPEIRKRRRRAWRQTFGRREAARQYRAYAAQKSRCPLARRSNSESRYGDGEGHSSTAKGSDKGQDYDCYRASLEHDLAIRSDSRSRQRPDR